MSRVLAGENQILRPAAQPTEETRGRRPGAAGLPASGSREKDVSCLKESATDEGVGGCAEESSGRGAVPGEEAVAV